MLKLGRGLRAKLQARHDEPITTSGKQPSWQAALDRLKELFDEPEWQDAEVNIVLSNRLVRYATIRFDEQLKKYSVKEAFARHQLAQVYGTAANLWNLRIQHGKAGTAMLVSAVDRALLEGLRQTCSAHKLRLHSITPYLMPVFNHYQKSITSDPAWLVINEPGYSLFVLLSGGKFVSANGAYHDKLDELSMLLDRENLVGPIAEPCRSVYLFSPSRDELSSIPAKGYAFNPLGLAAVDGFPSSSEGLYAMAMSGVF